MEELFLGTLLLGEELDIVDQQGIHRAIEALEFVDRIELQRLDHIGNKAFGMQINDFRVGVLLQQVIAHRMHQVGFPQAYSAIQEKRVVAMLGIVGHLPGSSTCQLVGLAFDEVFKGKGAIEVVGVLQPPLYLYGTLATQRGNRLFGRRAIRRFDNHWFGRRRGRRGRRLDGRRRTAACRTTPAANQQGQGRGRSRATLSQQLQQSTEVFVIDPIQYETIGRIDTQLLLIALDLQGTNPGIELLSRQLVTQQVDALLPQFHGHGYSSLGHYPAQPSARRATTGLLKVCIVPLPQTVIHKERRSSVSTKAVDKAGKSSVNKLPRTR